MTKALGKMMDKVATPPVEMTETLERLYAAILDRRGADPNVSYTAKLLGRGTAKIAQKFGEEAVEAAIAAVERAKPDLVRESADVLYHLLVMWADAGITPDEVWAELKRREGISGIAEKKARPKTG
ncbi:MAG: phosphoribosyl-ATP diphosphatase [Alphaproteobacteria bacterium]|nr:phosphoribosyl-ATP diphosphatase [Alphaproteobacteria bacterium]